MGSVLTVLAANVITLTAINLDDIFLLTVLFARRLPTRRIVAGQYLGFCSIGKGAVSGVPSTVQTDFDALADGLTRRLLEPQN